MIKHTIDVFPALHRKPGWFVGACSCGAVTDQWPSETAARAMIEEHADDTADELVSA